MNQIRYGLIGASFALAAVTFGLAGAATHEPMIVVLALFPAFAAGWSAAKASWS